MPYSYGSHKVLINRDTAAPYAAGRFALSYGKYTTAEKCEVVKALKDYSEKMNLSPDDFTKAMHADYLSESISYVIRLLFRE